MLEFDIADSINDITDENPIKLLLKQLNQKQLLLDAISQSSPFAYLVVDNRDDSILYFNDHFCSIWGIENLLEKMKNGQLKNNDIIPFCLELIADKPSFIETCKPLQDENNRATIEDEIQLTDGRIIRRYSGQVRDEFDNYIGRLYLFEDITERKNNEEKAALNKLQKYKLLSENAKDIILFVGMDGSILEANEAAAKSYGYTNEELCSMKIINLKNDEHASITMNELENAYENGYIYETVHIRKDGSFFPVEVSSQGTQINGQRMLLSIIRDISERKQMQRQLEYIARHDYLTQIPNRFYLEEFLKEVFTDIRNMEDAFLHIDLDNFKTINDTFGHSTGDKILIGVADSIKKSIGDKDFAARMGGDKFAVFLSDTNLEEARAVANKILHAAENGAYYIDERSIPIKITVSIGITIINSALDVSHLFSYADAALFVAKNEGKNRISVLENKKGKDLVDNANIILSQIHNALIKDKFQIYLQPIHKAGDGILHHEVLVRMLDENNQILSPAAFIPLAERYGLMPLIDKWVITNTLKVLNKNKNLKVFINLSGTSLGDETLLDWIELTLSRSNVNPNQIGFEITETTAIKDLEKTKLWINKIKDLGCSFALDDFGVGFSSFSYLNILPVDYLKIDGTFVRDLDSDPTKLALVQAMNMVAHTLGKKTIAEFVENEFIWKMLNDLGVDYGQGYYLGRPKPFENN